MLVRALRSGGEMEGGGRGRAVAVAEAAAL